MNKNEFVFKLRASLSGLPKADAEERISFYEEMIDDRIEDGIGEEEAVNSVGNVDEIVSQIISETPFASLVKERIKPKNKLNTWETVLIAVGSPLWLSLLIAAFAVVISLYASLLAVIIALWGVFVGLAAGGIGGIVAGVVITDKVNGLSGFAMIGAGMVCAGISVFAFYFCLYGTKKLIALTKKLAYFIKKLLAKKEEA